MAFTYRMISSDGREVEFDYPTQLSEEEAQYVADDLAFREDAREQEEAARARAEAKQKSDDYGVFTTDFLQDVPLSVMQAVGAAPRIVGQAATALGSEEFGPELLKDAEEYQKRIEGMKSEGYQARRAENALEMAQAEGPMDKFLTAAGQTLSPVMLSQELIKMAPELAMTGAAGRLASGLGAGARGTTAAAVGTGASLQSASVLGDVYQITYDAEIAKGTPPEEAASNALSAARANAAEMFGVSLATMMLPGATALERTLAGVGGGAGKSLVSGAVKGFLGEGTQEATEETYGELLKNIQESRYDPTKNIYEGLPEVAGQAGVLGGILGGPAGGLQGMRNAEVEALKKQAEEQQKADRAAEVAAIPTDEDGQMTLPGIPAPQAGPVLPEGGIPVAEPDMGPAPEQLDMFPVEQVETAPEVPDNWFGGMEPQDRIDAIDAELATFDENPDYETLSPKDKAAAKASLKRARKNAVADRQRLKLQAKEDAPKAAASAFSTAEEDLFGVVPEVSREQVDQVGPAVPEGFEPPARPQAQVSEAFGGPQQALPMFETYDDNQFAEDVGVNLDELGTYSRAGATFNKTRQDLVGLDLKKPEDRQKALEVLDRVDNLKRPSKWQDSLARNLKQRLSQYDTEALATVLEDQVTEAQQARVEEGRVEQEAADAELRAEADAQIDAQQETQKAAEMEKGWKEMARRQFQPTATEADMQQLEVSDFELDMQVVDEYAPALYPEEKVSATDLLNRYSGAKDANNKPSMDAIDTEAKAALGDRAWASLKGGLTRRQNQQLRGLREQVSGRIPADGQLDMFAQADKQVQRDRRRAEKTLREDRKIEGEVVEATTEEQAAINRALEADAKKAEAQAREAEAKAAKAEAEAKNAESAVRETEVGRRTRRDDQQPAGEPSVGVDVPASQPKPKTAKKPAAPKPRGVGDTGGTAGRDTGREVRKPTPLKEQIDQVETTGRSLADIEQDIYTTEGNEQNPYVIEYVKTQTGGLVTTEDFLSVKNAIKNDEALPTFEPREVVEEAPATPTQEPKSLSMLAKAKTKEQFNAVVDQAIEDGYFSTEEAPAIKDAFGGTPIGTIAAKRAILKRARDTEYFRNNPDKINGWLKTLDTLYDVEMGVDQEAFLRTPFTPSEPASTVADLERKFSSLINKVRKHNKVNIVQSASGLPIDVPSDIDGMYYQGEVYIVADNVSALDFEETLAHELVGHLGLEEMLGRGQFKSLLTQVSNLKNSSPRIRRVLDNIRKAYTNEQGAYNLDDVQEAREILAHIAQETPNYLTDNAVKRVYGNIKRAVRNFLAKLGFVNKGDALIDQLIYDAAMHVRDGYNANRKGRTFLRSGSPAQAMMQRAWDMGYRGLNLSEAASHLRRAHNGDEVFEGRTINDILNADINDNFLDEAAFSRKPIDPNKVDPEYREFIPEQESPKSKFIRTQEALKGGFIRNTINRFRIAMVDQVSTLEDKVMREYNNAVTRDGIINPIVSYVQALKHDALANGFMRTGFLRLRQDGLWDTSPVAGETRVSLVDVYKKIGELGKRIGSVETASSLASKVFVARREIEIHERNQKLEREAVALENEGKKAAAKAKRDQIKNIFLKVEDGRTIPMTKGEEDARLAEHRRLVDKHFNGEIQEAFDMFTEFKNGMLKIAKDTGFITQDKMDQWMENAAYVPFYRIKDNLDELDMKRGGSGMMNVETMKELRGSAKEVGNVLDNMSELAMWMTASIVKNHGAKELARGLRETGGIKAEYTNEQLAPRDAELVTYYEDGKKKFIEPLDPLDAYAFRGMENTMMTGGIMKMLNAGAEGLRKGITLSPDFILSQLEQDTFRAYGFSGVKNPFKAAKNVVPSFMRVRKDLAGGNMGNEQLNKLGILGMYDISPQHTREQVELPITGDNMTGFQKLLRWGERNAEASDLAQRLAIYEQTLAEGGSEVEAFWRASEIINFSRRGNSKTATFLRQVVPFQNAYAQGMNILAKTMSGRGLSQQEKKQAFLTFARAGIKLSALSTLAAMAMADDDEYANQPHHLRSRYLMAPTPWGDGFLKLAMPADLGFLFKHIPETIVMAAMRDDFDSEKITRETTAAFLHAVMGPNVMPQLIKPSAEAFFNYSFFTGAPIVGLGEEQLTTDKQYRENTSLIARMFGEIGISPLKADHVIRGTFGTVGAYGILATDMVGEQVFDIERTDRELADYPIAKTLFTREKGNAFKADFYQLRREVRSLVATKNLLKREGRGDELVELMSDEDNRLLLSMQKAVNRVDKTIKESNAKIKKIQASKMDGERKRELINAERDRQARLAQQISRMRNYAYQ